MNLRAKLDAIQAEKKSAPASSVPEVRFTDCWKRRALRPLTEVEGAFGLDRENVALMTEAELPQPLDPARILYLDTETTGLGGGSGTVAFEVGLGFLTEEGFEVRQLVMRDYPEEVFLLREVEKHLRRFDVVCTFNGSTFDLPLLRTRFLMNRMRPDCLDMPHIDLLHIARRVFKLRLGRCNLTRLEEVILGQTRTDDLPGSQVPQRYFDYLKTGNFDLLTDVLRHNEQDIASLCVLLTRMAEWYGRPQGLRHAEDVLSMGVALERAKHTEQAKQCYRLVPAGRYHALGQQRLALRLRRDGRGEEAASVWKEMIARNEGGAHPYTELAKYYEHILRDPERALDMTREALIRFSGSSLGGSGDGTEALLKRYDRLRRKVDGKK